jgi:hypothetical protein
MKAEQLEENNDGYRQLICMTEFDAHIKILNRPIPLPIEIYKIRYYKWLSKKLFLSIYDFKQLAMISVVQTYYDAGLCSVKNEKNTNCKNKFQIDVDFFISLDD